MLLNFSYPAEETAGKQPTECQRNKSGAAMRLEGNECYVDIASIRSLCGKEVEKNVKNASITIRQERGSYYSIMLK